MVVAEQPLKVTVEGKIRRLEKGARVPGFDALAFHVKAFLIRLGRVRLIDDDSLEASSLLALEIAEDKAAKEATRVFTEAPLAETAAEPIVIQADTQAALKESQALAENTLKAAIACAECATTFANRANLARHMRSKHRGAVR